MSLPRDEACRLMASSAKEARASAMTAMNSPSLLLHSRHAWTLARGIVRLGARLRPHPIDQPQYIISQLAQFPVEIDGSIAA